MFSILLILTRGLRYSLKNWHPLHTWIGGWRKYHAEPFCFFFTFIPWLLKSFDSASYSSVSRKRCPLRLLFMCLEGDVEVILPEVGQITCLGVGGNSVCLQYNSQLSHTRKTKITDLFWNNIYVILPKGLLLLSSLLCLSICHSLKTIKPFINLALYTFK